MQRCGFLGEVIVSVLRGTPRRPAVNIKAMKDRHDNRLELDDSEVEYISMSSLVQKETKVYERYYTKLSKRQCSHAPSNSSLNPILSNLNAVS